MQNKLMIQNNRGEWVDIPTPSTYKAAVATTSSEDSGRDLYMGMHNNILGTVEAYSLTWRNISALDAAKILQLVVDNPHVQIHYFSLYYGMWRDGDFYAANYNAPVTNLKEGTEMWEELSFQITGNAPI